MSSKIKIEVATVAKYFSNYCDADKNGVVSTGDVITQGQSTHTLSEEDIGNSWKIVQAFNRISDRYFSISKEWHGSRQELFLSVSKENDSKSIEAKVDIGYLRKVKTFTSGHDKPDHEV